MELSDAIALERAIQSGAHDLLADRPDLPLDARRAHALGGLADQSLGGDREVAREVVIYAHHDTRASHGIVGVEGMGSPITVEHHEQWCRAAGTRVSIRPVLDLDEEIFTASYTPTGRQREQAVLTCGTCVAPGCGRPARACDLDHINPWRPGAMTATEGATTSGNLAPLCRGCHRLKTHGGWSYRRLGRARFEWTTPHGRVYLVDLTYKRRTP